MAPPVCVVLSAAEREQLAAIAADRNRPRKHVERAQIVLTSADRHSPQQVARSIGVSRPTVWWWQQRFAESGVDGLLRDKTRKPGKAPIAAETAAQVVALACAEPPHEATHWTGRAMAKNDRHLAGFGAAHLAGAQTAAAPAATPSSARAIPALPTSSLMLSGSMSIRRPMRSCCRSMRKARSKRSTAPSPGCDQAWTVPDHDA